ARGRDGSRGSHPMGSGQRPFGEPRRPDRLREEHEYHGAGMDALLRKQLALYIQRHVKLQRADDPTRITLVAESLIIGWMRIVTFVKLDSSLSGIVRPISLF